MLFFEVFESELYEMLTEKGFLSNEIILERFFQSNTELLILSFLNLHVSTSEHECTYFTH